jgi:hypothetical protein
VLTKINQPVKRPYSIGYKSADHRPRNGRHAIEQPDGEKATHPDADRSRQMRSRADRGQELREPERRGGQHRQPCHLRPMLIGIFEWRQAAATVDAAKRQRNQQSRRCKPITSAAAVISTGGGSAYLRAL